ncbi:histamine H2 receptor-like [Acanthaster planci]|uniref:Histamine H2 receptor-like n=1 Tax=Acanthaster planci TaxID=133434 RepID=A0A8B7Y079_ACAPL|nr:histamine H2 receptor-like [Acanthaster planci]
MDNATGVGLVRDLDSINDSMNSTENFAYESTSQTVFLLIVYGVIGTLGIIGNGIVILVYIFSPSFLRNVTSSIVCNQSAIDLAMSVIFVVINLGPQLNLPSDPAFADFLCKVWLSEYAIWALGASSTCNLVYLTIERHVAVFHPFYYRSKFTLRKARLICVIPWIVGPIHELGWGLTNRVINGTCTSQWPSVQMGLAIGFISLIDHYVIPLCIMAFVYSRIICKLRHAWRKADMPRSGARRRLVRQASRNVIITTFLVSLTYLVCWGPNEITYFYVNMGGDVNMSGMFFRFTVVVALVNMCINPFIYAMCYKDFRRGLWLCLRRNQAHNAPSPCPSHSHDHDVISSTTQGFHDARKMPRYKKTVC